jgi:two-component system, response regulator
MATLDEILLIEDDPNDVLLFRLALKKAGVAMELVALDNGQQAIDYLGAMGRFKSRQGLPPPRVVLLDLNLPVIPGLEVLAWVKSRPDLISLPMLVMTSSCNQRDVEECRSRGAQGFLIKPLSNDERVGLATYLKEHWFAAAQHPLRASPLPAFVAFVAGPRTASL